MLFALFLLTLLGHNCSHFSHRLKLSYFLTSLSIFQLSYLQLISYQLLSLIKLGTILLLEIVGVGWFYLTELIRGMYVARLFACLFCCQMYLCWFLYVLFVSLCSMVGIEEI